jgi:hypothetical protein
LKMGATTFLRAARRDLGSARTHRP